jgi:hypothetical protein
VSDPNVSDKEARAPAEAGASRAGQDRGRLADPVRRAMNDEIGQVTDGSNPDPMKKY